MPKKKTHGEYVEELKVVNPDIEVVGIYVGANIKILHRCLKDGHEWLATPHNILRGRGCPKCAGHIQRTHEMYVNDVSKINQNIEVVGEYINNVTPILHRCIIHNIRWDAYPNNVLRGHGCKQCANELLREQRAKDKEQYIKDLKNVNQDIIVLGEYINAHIPILHKCLIDDYEWYATANNTLNGYGCPKCTVISKGEKIISQLLDSHAIAYIQQKRFEDCRDIQTLPFDFYLPDYNILIEYDGIQHYEPIDYFGGQEAFETTVKHDNMKNEYCKNNGISLLRIPYFKNVEEELNNFLFI